ncbi:MAG TPA: tRNA (N6-threonylcarbamoyladenosine(37)-N6)-methyltransferase TrmO [Candidatus Binatia bacterium]|nr:tRNA (N6-threonylcarbamoyladenosine(37)-N6)-methyltransferase TrmO [Candidatus Binatia bacterium]
MPEATAELRVIGVARTPWSRREDAPHQGEASPDSRATLEIEEQYRGGLADLASFARIWILFLFDRSRGWSATVKPPRGGPKRGVFATRAPNRPSQIGLSSAALVCVREAEGIVELQGVDLLDGTPVLDVKPYVAWIDAHPDAGNGWLQPFLDAGVEPRLKKPYRPPR